MITQKEKVFEMLTTGAKTTSDFLKAYIPRFSARILELKNDGVDVESKKVRKGEWKYWIPNPIQMDLFEKRK